MKFINIIFRLAHHLGIHPMNLRFTYEANVYVATHGSLRAGHVRWHNKTIHRNDTPRSVGMKHTHVEDVWVDAVNIVRVCSETETDVTCLCY